MKRKFIFILFTIILTQKLLANSSLITVISKNIEIDSIISIDYNNPLFEYSGIGDFSNIFWKGKAGGELILVGFKTEIINSFLTINGFLELHNFNKNYPVPWELYRANFGSNLIFDFIIISKIINNSKFILSLGANHESDHISNLYSFSKSFLNFENINIYKHNIYSNNKYFNYVNFSTFEYFKINGNYQQFFINDLIGLSVFCGFKSYFYINTESIRKMNYSIQFEINFQFKLFNEIYLFGGYFHENIKNNFVSTLENFTINHNKDDYIITIVEIGILINNNYGKLFPFIKYYDNNGLGADFLIRYKEFGCGIKFIL